jgi:hypothetical protein
MNTSKRWALLVAAVLVFAMMAVPALADVNPVTPSTNDINRTNGWAHVDQTGVGIGFLDVSFISTRAFWSCFEYRSDGDTTQVIAENGGLNYNTDILDGLYPYTCVNNNTAAQTLTADEYVEIRMVFGAERDERFDWTRFDVMAEAPAMVDICHLNGVSDVIPTFNPGTDLRLFYPGMVITVAQAAVPAHLAHGDSATLGSGDGEYRTDAAGLANIRQSAENNGLRVWKHADCFVTRLP